MKYVTINQGSNSTVYVLSSDTTTTLLSGVEINVGSGAAINAANGATDRNIVINGTVASTTGDGIDIGIQNKAGDFVGGGNLDIGANAMVTGGMTGVAVLADGETIHNQGKITSADTALFSERAHLTLDNSGTISGDKFAAALVGARSLLTNDGTISSTAGSGVELSGNHANAINKGTISGHLFGVEFAQGAQHEVHLFTNNGTVHGGVEAIEGSGDREIIRNNDTMSGDVYLRDGNDLYIARKGATYGTVYGDGGNDVYVIGKGQHLLSENPGEGYDTVKSSVSYSLGDNFERLILIGNSGNNALNGGEGKDTLFGGAGQDVLTGGTGTDTFIFKTGSGADTITDFTVGGKDHDVLDLSAFTDLHTLSDLQAHMTLSGFDTVIDFGNGDTLTLTNVLPQELHGHGADFIF